MRTSATQTALMTTVRADRTVGASAGLGELPRRFGRYEIERRIGVGGMGVVYEGVHSLLRKRVALKILHADQPVSDAQLARFVREGESAARVRHPNIVDIVDVGVESGIPFLVMELLEGEDLGHLLQREGRLSAQRSVDLLLPVLAGLVAAHRQGIVHRDLKPENVFLARDAQDEIRPTLLDFGISLDLAHGDEPAAAFSGTPYYMAPEQIRGRGIDARSDQYALGVVLFQCVVGRRPFEADSLADLLIAIDDGQLPALPGELPAGLAAVIQRATARDKEQRYASTEELGCALLPFAGEEARAVYGRAFASERRPSSPPARWSEQELTQCCAGLLSSQGSADLPSVSAPDAGVRARPWQLPVPRSWAHGRLMLFPALLMLLLATAGAVSSAAVPSVRQDSFASN